MVAKAFRAQETQESRVGLRAATESCFAVLGTWLWLGTAGVSLWDCLGEHSGPGHVPTDSGQQQR